MTTLFRSVPITSAEQAEALPVGTLVPRANGRLPKKREDGTWGDLWGDCGLFDVIGYTAFVPIEAEEHVQELHGIKKTVPWGELIEVTYPGINETADSRDWRRQAYWTPWEEA